MTTRTFTIDDLRRILLAGAGADEHVDLGADIEHLRFADLGYDSLALLETSGRIEREFDVKLTEDLTESDTPHALVALVNKELDRA